MPAANVILEALNLYQSTFRKPSLIVFCLDYSGSMEGGGEQQLEEAMATLLDPAQASKYFLQRTGSDTTIVLPFSDGLKGTMKVEGNSSSSLLDMLENVQQTDASGGTNIYGCLQDAQAYFTGPLEDYAPAIILMTDGRSNKGSFDAFKSSLPHDPVPVYSVLFGDASRDQLEQISNLTGGDIYDGTDELITAMRDAFANA